MINGFCILTIAINRLSIIQFFDNVVNGFNMKIEKYGDTVSKSVSNFT